MNMYIRNNVQTSCCSVCLSGESFVDYASISDYMAKRRKTIWLLICGLLSGLCLSFYLFIAGMPIAIVVACALLFLAIIISFIVSLVCAKPPWWWIRYQRQGIVRIYKESLGYKENEEIKECKFNVNQGGLSFATERREIKIPLDEVRWVKQKGDLVVVGCFDGWNSLTNATMGSREDHYEACPAAAFLKSKLKGMAPDELIRLLKECAKKLKPPNPRGYIRDLPDGKPCYGNDVYSA